MFQNTLDVIASFFSGLDIKRRWFILIFILVILIAGLYFFEVLTGHYYYTSLEKKVALLTELNKLSDANIASKSELYPIFKSTVSELQNRAIRPLSLPTNIFINSAIFWKTFTGSFVGLLFLILSLFGLMKTENVKEKKNMIVGFIFITIFGGVIGALVPVIFNEWVNYIGIPLLIMVSFMMFGLHYNKKSSQP